MKHITGFLILVILVSCGSMGTKKTEAPAAPSVAEIKEQVILFYDSTHVRPGSPGWNINSITILSVDAYPGKANYFKTVSYITGIETSPALAEPLPDRPFSDTVKINLMWNGAGWGIASDE